MRTGPVTWTRDSLARVPLQRFVGRCGRVEVGRVEYDGSNRLWVWSSPLDEGAWGWGPSEDAARQALETWLRQWLENFRSFFEAP